MKSSCIELSQTATIDGKLYQFEKLENAIKFWRDLGKSLKNKFENKMLLNSSYVNLSSIKEFSTKLIPEIYRTSSWKIRNISKRQKKLLGKINLNKIYRKKKDVLLVVRKLENEKNISLHRIASYLSSKRFFFVRSTIKYMKLPYWEFFFSSALFSTSFTKKIKHKRFVNRIKWTKLLKTISYPNKILINKQKKIQWTPNQDGILINLLNRFKLDLQTNETFSRKKFYNFAEKECIKQKVNRTKYQICRRMINLQVIEKNKLFMFPKKEKNNFNIIDERFTHQRYVIPTIDIIKMSFLTKDEIHNKIYIPWINEYKIDKYLNLTKDVHRMMYEVGVLFKYGKLNYIFRKMKKIKIKKLTIPLNETTLETNLNFFKINFNHISAIEKILEEMISNIQNKIDIMDSIQSLFFTFAIPLNVPIFDLTFIHSKGTIEKPINWIFFQISTDYNEQIQEPSILYKLIIKYNKDIKDKIENRLKLKSQDNIISRINDSKYCMLTFSMLGHIFSYIPLFKLNHILNQLLNFKKIGSMFGWQQELYVNLEICNLSRKCSFIPLFYKMERKKNLKYSIIMSKKKNQKIKKRKKKIEFQINFNIKKRYNWIYFSPWISSTGGILKERVILFKFFLLELICKYPGISNLKLSKRFYQLKILNPLQVHLICKTLKLEKRITIRCIYKEKLFFDFNNQIVGSVYSTLNYFPRIDCINNRLR